MLPKGDASLDANPKGWIMAIAAAPTLGWQKLPPG
jgi:hypothetical protein